MSKIELTEEQAKEVYRAFTQSGGYQNTVRTTLDKAIELGLVRPASDDPMQREWEDVKARVATLEAKVQSVSFASANIAIDKGPEARQTSLTPDPHAAAKDDYPADVLKACPQAREWSVVLRGPLDNAQCEWRTTDGKYYWASVDFGVMGWKQQWFETQGVGGTREQALSKPPTEPPPGWEAAKSPLSICGIPVDPTPKNAKPEPHTDADRLAVVAFDEDSRDAGQIWARQDESTKQAYRNIAHAVRKADRAAQLEPREEELAAAWTAWPAHARVGVYRENMRNALIAAACVRLEKVEGEKP